LELTNVPVDALHENVGRRESTRAPPVGDSATGADTLSVEPSAAAAVELPTAADGDVGVSGDVLHEATAKAASNAVPDTINLLVIEWMLLLPRRIRGKDRRVV
jgi:hypothetical protein